MIMTICEHIREYLGWHSDCFMQGDPECRMRNVNELTSHLKKLLEVLPEGDLRIHATSLYKRSPMLKTLCCDVYFLDTPLKRAMADRVESKWDQFKFTKYFLGSAANNLIKRWEWTPKEEVFEVDLKARDQLTKRFKDLETFLQFRDEVILFNKQNPRHSAPRPPPYTSRENRLDRKVT